MYHRALKLIREFHRMSQSEAATKTGLSNSYISELEKGSKKASLDVLEKYAAAFRIPVSSLLVFAEAMDSESKAERIRVGVAEKVLKMLEWVRDGEEHTAA